MNIGMCQPYNFQDRLMGCRVPLQLLQGAGQTVYYVEYYIEYYA